MEQLIFSIFILSLLLIILIGFIINYCINLKNELKIQRDEYLTLLQEFEYRITNLEKCLKDDK